MKILNTSAIFNGVKKELIENAKAELEADSIFLAQNLRHENHNLYNARSISYFRENHRTDLTVYKQKKSSGYSLILLYKRTVLVGSVDFMSYLCRELEQEFDLVQNWPVYQLHKLKIKVLENLFKDPWDRRTSHCFTPTAESIWEIIESTLTCGVR